MPETEIVETGRTGLMDAVDSNGRTIHPRDTVRDTRIIAGELTGRLYEVTRLYDGRLPAHRAVRGKAYRPIFLAGLGWRCPHHFTIEVRPDLGVVR